jgi:uncharacterized membrane protein (DUF2068 family)
VSFYAEEEPVKQRPGGVTLIAIAFLVLGAFSLIWSLIVFGFGGLAWVTGAIFDATGMAASGSTNTWQGFLGLLGASLQLVTGFGLLALKRWAWFLAFLAVAVTVIQGISGIFGGGFFALCCGVFGLIIPAGILFYLLRRDVRAAFGQ